MTSLINRKACKQYLLDYAAGHRAHKFTRVSATVWPAAESALRRILEGIVEGQPSKGKTIK